MKEIWKDIPEYEGLYQASNLGRIKSVDKIVKRKNVGNFFKKGTILKLQKSKNGYLLCKLSKNGVCPSKFVHTIIAKTFIENSDGLPCINHKDENKTNNCVNNLEWCSYQYNNTYGTKTERIRKKLLNRKHTQEELKKMSVTHLGIPPKNKGKKRFYINEKKYVYR